MKTFIRGKKFGIWILLGALVTVFPMSATAKDVDYDGTEFSIRVEPGEPTQITFPGKISGGFKRAQSVLNLDRKEEDLVIFATPAITDSGEAIIVRLEDGRSYSVRVQRASLGAPRDAVVKVFDERGAAVARSDEEEEPAYINKQFQQAPPSQVSGLMREMVLASEFGKAKITGYRVSDRFQGEPILNDGAMTATISKIYMGPNLWGYELDVANQLGQTQQVNPATFRLDGTRAISASNWELAPRPITAEQQISGKHRTKVYVVTKAKRTR